MSKINQQVKSLARRFGFEIQRIPVNKAARPPREPFLKNVPPLDPIWPLPRRANGMSDDQIREEFSKFEYWYYGFQFEGGLAFRQRFNNPGPLTEKKPEEFLQRFRNFMPYVQACQGGSLKGKRVLDIACNEGYWSIQCALLGADVVGFDARPYLIAQANLIKSIVGVENVEFKTLDFWDMNPETLGGTFDVVLCLGILYHLPKTLEALKLVNAMTRSYVLLDTGIHPSPESLIRIDWEDPIDIRDAATPGVIAFPTPSAIDLLLRHLGVADWFQIPLRGDPMPPEYARGTRASWLIKV